MTFSKTIISACVGAFMGLSSLASAADIVIAQPNWATAKLTAYILKTIIEDNMGLDVELQTASNPVIFEAMESGSMHIHPEVWLPNQANLHNKYVKQRGTVLFARNGIPAFQGMCTTKATADALGIKKITDLSDPDMAANFDLNGDGKGEIYIGGSGWASTLIERIRAKSYGYDETLELQELAESAAYGNLDSAVANGKHWVGYCYTPHHLFALHDIVILEEPKYDASKWKIVQPTDAPDWLEQSDAGVAWDLAYLHVHYAKALQDSYPEVARMLSKISLTTEAAGDMAYADTVDRVNPEEYARKWVDENASLIASWLK